MSFHLMPSISNSTCASVTLCMFLIGIPSILMANESGEPAQLLMDRFPKPHEIELARQGVAEANIDKPWGNSLPLP